MRRLATSSAVTAGGRGDGPLVEDALVGVPGHRARVEDGIRRREPARHVVRVEHRDLGGPAQPVRPHHADVGPRDREDAGEPHGAPRSGRCPSRPGLRLQRVIGQVRAQVLSHRDRATPGPPPPCGMQNVLCRFRCDTSAPSHPGRARPTSALRFAPSRYTCPPCSCTTSHTSRISRSYTPWSTDTSP
jgi:hypothetical protein